MEKVQTIESNVQPLAEAVELSESYIQSKYVELEPKILTAFTPENAKVAKADFLANASLDKPANNYSKLSVESAGKLIDDIDDFETQLEKTESGINPKLIDVYSSSFDFYKKKAEFIKIAAEYNTSDDSDIKSQKAREFMDLNIELFNEPDKSVYQSLINEKFKKIKKDKLDQSSLGLYEELKLSISGNEAESKRFVPSQELVDEMGERLDFLFANFFRHLPDQEKFNPEEIASIFGAIVSEEFHGAADDWKIDLSDKKKAITVNSEEKTIYIPIDRKPAARADLKGLIAHEIGTHMMRAVMGEQSGIGMLQLGLDGYTDAEEGVAKVLEQSAKGKFSDSGIDHYITIGLAYFENMNFRQVFDFKWKMNAIEKAAKNGELTGEIIEESKSWAYDQAQRIFRGTGELPFFKDLAYYNGSMKVWQYVNDNIDDPWMLDRILLDGKSDMLDSSHQRIVYEAKVGGYN